jgi:hypothetical protein
MSEVRTSAPAYINVMSLQTELSSQGQFQFLFINNFSICVCSNFVIVFLVYRYADFKPPSSPSPSAPITSLSTSSVSEVPKIDAVSTNGPAQPSVEDKPKDDGQQLNEPKSRPLSPYAM